MERRASSCPPGAGGGGGRRNSITPGSRGDSRQSLGRHATGNLGVNPLRGRTLVNESRRSTALAGPGGGHLLRHSDSNSTLVASPSSLRSGSPAPEQLRGRPPGQTYRAENYEDIFLPGNEGNGVTTNTVRSRSVPSPARTTRSLQTPIRSATEPMVMIPDWSTPTRAAYDKTGSGLPYQKKL